MLINERFKKIRDHLLLGQTDFADSLNETQANISRWESGKIKDIPNNIMQLLYSKYNVNINWLLTGSGQMFLTEKPPPSRKPIEERLEDIEDSLTQITQIIMKTNKLIGSSNDQEQVNRLLDQLKKNQPELMKFKQAVDSSKLAKTKKTDK